MPFSREDLPNPGIEPRSPTLQADSLPPEPQGKPAKDASKKTAYGMGKYLQIIYLIKGFCPECIKNSYNSAKKKVTQFKDGQRI